MDRVSGDEIWRKYIAFNIMEYKDTEMSGGLMLNCKNIIQTCHQLSPLPPSRTQAPGIMLPMQMRDCRCKLTER